MALPEYKQKLLEAALSGGALRFGEFELKSKRLSPYFFNAGSFYTGALHVPFVDAFASTIASDPATPAFDVIFGPAYKGIPLAAAVFYALAKADPARFAAAGYAFDRKEAKTHGEGGNMVGSPVEGGKRVLIIDDVVSSGTAKRKAIEDIRAAGGVVAGIVVALDRQETLPETEGTDRRASAIGELQREYNIPVISIVRLDDIISGMKGIISNDDIRRIEEYRAKYGASD